MFTSLEKLRWLLLNLTQIVRLSRVFLVNLSDLIRLARYCIFGIAKINKRGFKIANLSLFCNLLSAGVRVGRRQRFWPGNQRRQSEKRGRGGGPTKKAPGEVFSWEP